MKSCLASCLLFSIWAFCGRFAEAQTPTETTLQNGGPISNLSGSTGSASYFKISIPTGQAKIEIKTYGGSGDLDLHVKFGSRPSIADSDYSSGHSGNGELAPFNNPAAGTWYIMFQGFSAYSGATLVATYTPQDSTLTHTLSVSSNMPGSISITVTPADNNGQGNGSTPFTRVYNNGTSATLTASSSITGKPVKYCEKDGVNAGSSFFLTICMHAYNSVKAIYGIPQTISGKVTTGSGAGVSGLEIWFSNDVIDKPENEVGRVRQVIHRCPNVSSLFLHF